MAVSAAAASVPAEGCQRQRPPHPAVTSVLCCVQCCRAGDVAHCDLALCAQNTYVRQSCGTQAFDCMQSCCAAGQTSPVCSLLPAVLLPSAHCMSQPSLRSCQQFTRFPSFVSGCWREQDCCPSYYQPCPACQLLPAAC